MKKILVAFGIGVGAVLSSHVYAAGTITQTDTTNDFIVAATDIGQCRNQEDPAGFWVNTLETTGRNHCLAETACQDLEIEYKTKGSENDVEKIGENFIVTAVTCDDDSCLTNGDEHRVTCYDNDGEITNEPTNCRIDSKSIFSSVPAIDDMETSDPEWYCPKETLKFADGKDPYDNLDGYFSSKLEGTVYNYTPDNNELIKHCSSRMFALANSCKTIFQKASAELAKIRNIRTDFIAKRSIGFAKDIIDEAGYPAQWNLIKDVSFEKIQEHSITDGGEKQKAHDRVKVWLETNADKQTSAETPARYVKQKATDVWNNKDPNTGDPVVTTADDVMTLLKKEDEEPEYTGNEAVITKFTSTGKPTASESFNKIITDAAKLESRTGLIQQYISRRNSDLNISVSVNQTKSIPVSKFLRLTDNSDEAKLAAFNSDENHINIFDKIIRLAVRTMGTLAILILIITGVMMVISQGDENKLAEAKSAFVNTLIGLVIGFLSYTIVRFIIDTLLS